MKANIEESSADHGHNSHGAAAGCGNMIMVSSGHNTYRMKAECDGCKTSLDDNDIVRCCFICKTIYHEVCVVEKKYHNEHWLRLHGAKPLVDYIDKG